MTFVVIYATSPWALDRFPFLRSLLLGPEERKAVQTRAFNLIWACAVGAHLGSYFWSGIAKIQVGGDNALTWVLAPLAALSVSVLSAFGLLYDFFHIGVYFTLGALLFFWIALNLVIVAAAAASLPRNGIIPAMKTVMALTILFGHYFYYTNHLGWLDTAKLSSPQFYAVTRDSRQVEVPFNYFGIYSYTIAQTAMYVADGHFPFRPAGNALDPETWEDGVTCGPQVLEHQTTGATLDAGKTMILDTDRLMRDHPAVKSNILYYFYPHHMLPNPWIFTGFNNLGIDDVVAYEYVLDSVCLTLKDGRLARDVHKHSTFRIDLR